MSPDQIAEAARILKCKTLRELADALSINSKTTVDKLVEVMKALKMKELDELFQLSNGIKAQYNTTSDAPIQVVDAEEKEPAQLSAGLTPNQLEICRQTGCSPERFMAVLSALRRQNSPEAIKATQRAVKAHPRGHEAVE